MKRKFRLIPFMFISKKGLTGVDLEIEKIKYYYKDDHSRSLRILELSHPNKNDLEYKIQKLNLEYENKLIDNNQFMKELANLHRKPYIAFVNTSYSKDTNGKMTFAVEMDWNDIFVEELKSQGYTGFSNDEIVDKWFIDMSAQISQTNYLFGE